MAQPAPSSSLIEQYKELHKTDTNFIGLTVLKYASEIADLCHVHEVASLLDFGCGKGGAYGEKHAVFKRWPIKQLTLYDPAVKEFAGKPTTTFDAVISIDVAEHIEEHKIDEYIEELANYAEKFIFVTICTRPARKTLPDGRNAHLTLRPIEWWRERFAGARPFTYLRFS